MLHERLKELIVRLGMKKKDFARRIGFTPAYISMILTARKGRPSDRFFDAVEREFRVSAAWLRNGEGEMFLMPGGELSKRDISVIKKYHLLPLHEKKIVDEVVDALLAKRMAADEAASVADTADEKG